MSDFIIWGNRWESIKKASEKALLEPRPSDGIEDVPSPQDKRESMIADLRVAWRDFGQNQFNFFYEGFGFNGESAKLEESAEYPPEYVLRWTLDQLSFDHFVIENALKQGEDGEKKTILDQADLLAYSALQPVIGEGKLLLPETKAITYFQKVPAVRLIPYKHVALIAIPFSTIGEKTGSSESSSLRDLLAIPHEVGHFVYWRGRVQDERLRILLQQQLMQKGFGKYAHWAEEIFADVYGCLVGGTAIALSFQDLAMDNLPLDLVKDDGSHPASVVRWYIYKYVIERKAAGDGATFLSEEWEKRIEKRGKPATFRLKSNSGNCEDEIIGIEDGQKAMKEIVNIILDEILDDQSFESRWSREANADDEPLSIYKSFVDKIGSIVDQARNSRESSSEQTEGASLNSPIFQLRNIPHNHSSKMPADIWKLIMNADGWGNGGPECDGTTGVC